MSLATNKCWIFLSDKRPARCRIGPFRTGGDGEAHRVTGPILQVTYEPRLDVIRMFSYVAWLRGSSAPMTPKP